MQIAVTFSKSGKPLNENSKQNMNHFHSALAEHGQSHISALVVSIYTRKP